MPGCCRDLVSGARVTALHSAHHASQNGGGGRAPTRRCFAPSRPRTGAGTSGGILWRRRSTDREVDVVSVRAQRRAVVVVLLPEVVIPPVAVRLAAAISSLPMSTARPIP